MSVSTECNLNFPNCPWNIVFPSQTLLFREIWGGNKEHFHLGVTFRCCLDQISSFSLLDGGFHFLFPHRVRTRWLEDSHDVRLSSFVQEYLCVNCLCREAWENVARCLSDSEKRKESDFYSQCSGHIWVLISDLPWYNKLLVQYLSTEFESHQTTNNKHFMSGGTLDICGVFLYINWVIYSWTPPHCWLQCL